ncbi:HNH endonuclease [uncultured Methanobrevibacter sp.]
MTLHHAKSIKDFLELQYRSDNLKSICKTCHENLHELEF